jgi:hypothetical protein
MTDASDTRARDLAAFANASGQPNQPTPGGHALVKPTTGLAERVFGAQPVAVYRDEQKILQKLTALAAAAGSDWFYRFPVKKKEGGQDWIEGPSIKLANDVARIFGNDVIEIRELDVGDAWTFYARFTDIETGFSMERAYRQRKSQASMRTRDADRQLDIAYQIGQSKAIRNCICNALQIYCDFAFEQARNSLVEKIGKDLNGWRQRAIEGLARMPVELARVERVIGRPAKDWLAPNIAQVVAMMKSVADGMASTDEVFPPLEEIQSGGAVDKKTKEASTTSDSARSSSAEEGEGGGEHEAESATQGRPVSAASDRAEAPASAEPSDRAAAADPSVVADAYERGKADRAKGHARKAVPPDFRDANQTALAAAWLRGWDAGDH